MYGTLAYLTKLFPLLTDLILLAIKSIHKLYIVSVIALFRVSYFFIFFFRNIVNIITAHHLIKFKHILRKNTGFIKVINPPTFIGQTTTLIHPQNNFAVITIILKESKQYYRTTYCITHIIFSTNHFCKLNNCFVL